MNLKQANKTLRDKNIDLLIHGTQPKNSNAGKALALIKKESGLD